MRRLEQLEKLLEKSKEERLFTGQNGEAWRLATKYSDEIGELKGTLEKSIQRRWQEMRRLLAYIEAIDDSLIRQILMCRYVDGMAWVRVAMNLGGNNTEESVKKAAYRYLKKANEGEK